MCHGPSSLVGINPLSSADFGHSNYLESTSVSICLLLFDSFNMCVYWYLIHGYDLLLVNSSVPWNCLVLFRLCVVWQFPFSICLFCIALSNFLSCVLFIKFCFFVFFFLSWINFELCHVHLIHVLELEPSNFMSCNQKIFERLKEKKEKIFSGLAFPVTEKTDNNLKTNIVGIWNWLFH